MKRKIWDALLCSGAKKSEAEEAIDKLLSKVKQINANDGTITISPNKLGKGSFGVVFPGYYSKDFQLI